MHDTHQVMAHALFYVQAYKFVPVRNLTLRILNIYGVEVYIHSFFDPFDNWRWVVTFVLGDAPSIGRWMKGGGGVRTLCRVESFLPLSGIEPSIPWTNVS